MRTAEQAAAYAIERANSGEQMAASGYCLQFVRECYPMAAYYYSAIDAWNAAAYQHPGGSPADAPPGFPCFFYSSSPYDHVVISVGGGDFASVWNEEIRILSAATVLDTFGPFIGYSEDLNRVRIYSQGGGVAATEDDEMMMIQRNKSTGSVSLIGSGWYVVLGDTSVAAWTTILGAGPKVVSEAYYDAALACLVQGPTAVWAAKIARGTQQVTALQELADAKTNAINASAFAEQAPAAVWATTVKRGSTPVAALQELADAKTYSIQADSTLDAIVASFRSLSTGDQDAVRQALDVERPPDDVELDELPRPDPPAEQVVTFPDARQPV